MADTFFSLHVHCVFSTKNREPLLVGETRERLWAFMGGIAKRNGVRPICIGGVEDHVHLLLSMPTTLSVAKTVQLIKGGSSAWIHDTFGTLRNFAWQTGYGAFAVSTSHVPDIIRYIQNQAEHHRAKSFQEEYVGFLKKHGISFEERFLWD
jgi:REP element-mobilizing transposase RayT